MSNTLARAKARFAADRDMARRQAALMLQAHVGEQFHLSGWTVKAREAFSDQWLLLDRHTDAGWDWHEVFRRHSEPDRLDMVLWGPGDRLCGLGLATRSGTAVHVRFIEGDPRATCPLKGRRILIFLECAALYGQAQGRAELRIEPVNERLATLYRQIYGFVLETSHSGRAYYRRDI